MTQVSAIETMLHEIVRDYPKPPAERPGLELVLHAPEVYVSRTAYDMQLMIDRVGKDITVLDLGGGWGLLSLGFARLGARVILLDDFETLMRAERWPAMAELFERYGVEVVNRDMMRDEPLPKADAIGMFHVMEHLHNSPKNLFSRCLDALPSGGVFVISGPNSQNLRKRIAAPVGKVKWSSMVDWYEKPVFRGHVREPDVSDLRYIANDLGLSDIELLGRNFVGMRSHNPMISRLAKSGDGWLRRWPQLCSDLYMVGQKP
jgi:cyclopropane fatty-acyl-phospholipid synthase-like methyltransferase